MIKSDYYICPYCLTKFPLSEVWFKCLEPPGSSKIKHESFIKKVSDALEKKKNLPKKYAKGYTELPKLENISYLDEHSNDLTKVLFNNLVKNHLFKATKKTVENFTPHTIPKTASCPYCESTHKTFTHVCPNPYCNKEIRLENNTHSLIAIAGDNQSGKSVYLGALMYAINRYLPLLTDYTVSLDENAKQYEHMYINMMVNNLTIPATKYDETIHHMTVTLSKSEYEYNFTFYDINGVAFKNPINTNTTNFTKPFSSPNCIIMLCSPEYFKQIRQDVLNNDDVPTEFGEFCQTLDNNYLRPENLLLNIFNIQEAHTYSLPSFRGLADSRTEFRKIPIAFCISKADFLHSLYENDKEISKVLEKSSLTDKNFKEINFEKFAKDLKLKNFALKSILKDKFHENALVSFIDNFCLNSNFFAISSFGYNKNEVNHANSIIPVNVLDPFVWFANSICCEIFAHHHNENISQTDSTDNKH